MNNLLFGIVSKAGGNSLTISPEFMSFQGDGTPYGSNMCNVTSNVSWNVTRSHSWITVVPSSGSNNGSFEVYCDFNSDLYNPRNGTVTVTGGGIERTIYISQDAGEPM
jgi:hypothetical protein